MGSACERSPEIQETQGVFQNINNLGEKYIFVSQLAQDDIIKVRLYRDKYTPDVQYAVKSIKKKSLRKPEFASLEKQVKLLKSLDHPNIIQHIGSYEDKSNLHIVMEYLEGYSLYKCILLDETDALSENQIGIITYDTLKALTYLHKNNIIHKNLKPENIIFTRKNDYSHIKLIGFGLDIDAFKKKIKKGESQNCSVIVGMSHYIAPEAIDGEFSEKSDMWSLGVILHIMLTGKFPFYDISEHKNIYYSIKNTELDVNKLKEAGLSQKAIRLLLSLLSKNPAKRPTAEECLKDPWLNYAKESKNFKKKINGPSNGMENEKNKENQINNKDLATLKKFARKTQLQKQFFFLMARIVRETDLKAISEKFPQFDSDNSGCISVDEIKEVMKHANVKISDEDLQELIDSLDRSGDGEIQYSEFIAAMLAENSFLDEDRLWDLFCFFSQGKDENKEITAGDVISKAKTLNIEINEDEIKEEFRTLESEGTRLDYKSFKSFVRK